MVNWIKNNPIKIGILVLVFITIICFLPLSNQTGYYLNDWHPLGGTLNNQSLYSMWSFERKGVGLLFSITYPILKNNHFLWQIFSISLRFLCTVGFYWLLNIILKNKHYFNLTASILFLIYPGFMQQPIALTFSNHFIGYALAIYSILFSIIALDSKTKSKKLFFVFLALFFELGYLFDYEYMIGYEGVRLMLLWFHYERNHKFNIKVMKRTLTKFLPYLISVVTFLYWRIFVFKSTRPATNIDLLFGKYSQDLFYTGLKFFLVTIQDFFETVWQSWSVPLFQTTANSLPYNYFISIILGISTVLIFLLTIKLLRFETSENTQNSNNDLRDLKIMMVIGFFTTLITLLPVILSDREVNYNWQMDRYTLHVTVGVSLLISGFIFSFVQKSASKYITFVLIFLSVITHYNNTIKYVEWWDYQRNLWWQLSWRAPNIKDGTQIIPLLPYGNRLQEGVEAWSAINSIYRDSETPTDGPLIIADVLNPQTVVEIYTNSKNKKEFRRILYTNDFSYPLLISYPSGGSCAHIIDGERLELSYFDEDIIYRAAKFSQIDRIDVSANAHTPSPDIFGEEPNHTWCFYYQKGSLLRQQENWTELASMGKYVLENNISPSDKSEWVPFLEGFIMINDLENANKIVSFIKQDKYTVENLCGIWIYEKAHPNTQIMDSLCSDLLNQ